MKKKVDKRKVNGKKNWFMVSMDDETTKFFDSMAEDARRSRAQHVKWVIVDYIDRVLGEEGEEEK